VAIPKDLYVIATSLCSSQRPLSLSDGLLQQPTFAGVRGSMSGKEDMGRAHEDKITGPREEGRRSEFRRRREGREKGRLFIFVG